MAPARQQPPPLYSKDEKVLCFHGELLYEAKVMDVQSGEKSGNGEAWEYKIHYKGWKKTWDDWVGKDRIRPFDDEHKELAAQLHAQAKRSMQATAKQTTKTSKVGNDSTRGSEERGSAAVQGGRGGRRGKDWELEQVSRLLFFASLSLTQSSHPSTFASESGLVRSPLHACSAAGSRRQPDAVKWPLAQVFYRLLSPPFRPSHSVRSSVTGVNNVTFPRAGPLWTPWAVLVGPVDFPSPLRCCCKWQPKLSVLCG